MAQLDAARRSYSNDAVDRRMATDPFHSLNSSQLGIQPGHVEGPQGLTPPLGPSPGASPDEPSKGTAAHLLQRNAARRGRSSEIRRLKHEASLLSASSLPTSAPSPPEALPDVEGLVSESTTRAEGGTTVKACRRQKHSTQCSIRLILLQKKGSTIWTLWYSICMSKA